MKMDYQEELKRTGSDGIKFNIKPLVEALGMDAYQVFFLSNSNEHKCFES